MGIADPLNGPTQRMFSQTEFPSWRSTVRGGSDSRAGREHLWSHSNRDSILTPPITVASVMCGIRERVGVASPGGTWNRKRADELCIRGKQNN